MIRRNFLFGCIAAFAFAPDASSIAGGASPSAAAAPGEVTGTDNAGTSTDPDAGKPDLLTPPPKVNSANITAKPAKEIPVADNPFSKQAGSKVKLVELTVLKLAVYETDGKHIAGDTVWTNEGRADELISTGYAEHSGKTEEVEQAEIRAFLADHNTPPRV